MGFEAAGSDHQHTARSGRKCFGAGGWVLDQDRSQESRPTEFIPHGIRYSLTLHNRYGTRVLGYDNAHAVKPPSKFKFAGRRLPYDHKHRTASDKGVPYTFDSAQVLLEDFFAEADKVIAAAIQGD